MSKATALRGALCASVSLREALADPALLGNVLVGESWATWRSSYESLALFAWSRPMRRRWRRGWTHLIALSVACRRCYSPETYCQDRVSHGLQGTVGVSR